ncbi:MAG: hypothetical protein E7357_02235 [Clostridiales bacterium]|nr:hypothetical protein [Clostridiales bacterium]
MINYGILSGGVMLSVGQSLASKQYVVQTADRKDSEYFYNFIMSSSRLILFAVWISFGFHFDWTTFLFAIGFAVGACLNQIGGLLATKNGPLSLTNLLIQLSLIIPILYGFIFWDEQITPLSIIGLVLVIVALFFILKQNKDKPKENKISLKWLIAVLVSVGGNAFAVIVQKQQQIVCNGQYMQTLLFFSSAFVFAYFFIVYLLRCKRCDNRSLLKHAYLPCAGGLCNGGVNITTMFLATRLSSQIVYPILALCSIILTQIAATFLYRERLTKWQAVGLLLGTVAIVLLNI